MDPPQIHRKMSNTFTFALEPEPEDLFKMAQELAKGECRVQLNGNRRSGSAQGMGFSGEYQAIASGCGTHLTITISKKPFYASWARIRTALDSILRPYLRG